MYILEGVHVKGLREIRVRSAEEVPIHSKHPRYLGRDVTLAHRLLCFRDSYINSARYLIVV